MSKTILLVDDDAELTQMLADYLSGEGFAVEQVHDGESAAASMDRGGHDLIVLDLMLPGMNGFDLLARLRRTSMTPVLMLTARGSDIDRIAGLDLGADDYLPKPFNPRELMARIRAILRRFTVQNGAARPQRGPLQIDAASFTARLNGLDVPLTGTEFRLLELLAQEPGEVLTRDLLAIRVLGRSPGPLDRSIDTHISNIRRKIASTAPGLLDIKNIRGQGYVLTTLARITQSQDTTE